MSIDTRAPTTVDAITAEIIRNAVVAITDEMKTNLMRTAYNMIIYEALDFTVGLFDAQGNTISIGLGLPMFIRGLSDAIKAKLAFYGLEGIEPGDILLTNDAYIMGSHLNHMIFTLPIFWDGQIVAFASSMAHWQDVGGVLRGATQDIYSEGLQLPIVKIFKRGQQDRELTDIIRMNVRFPDLAMGDFRAQVAAIKTGERHSWGCSSATAPRRWNRASSASTSRASGWLDRVSPRSRMESTRPSRSWMTTASPAATRSR